MTQEIHTAGEIIRALLGGQIVILSGLGSAYRLNRETDELQVEVNGQWRPACISLGANAYRIVATESDGLGEYALRALEGVRLPAPS